MGFNSGFKGLKHVVTTKRLFKSMLKRLPGLQKAIYSYMSIMTLC